MSIELPKKCVFCGIQILICRGGACLRRVAFGKSSAKLFNFWGALVVKQDFSLRLRLVKKIPHCRFPSKGC